MLVFTSNTLILASFFGGWEIVLIMAVMLILFGAKQLPGLAKGFGDGLSQFGKELDGQAHDAGRSLGGIYGKPAGEALTPDNQTAELYDPALSRDEDPNSRGRRGTWFRNWFSLWRSVWHSIINRLKSKS